jgi:hypothetical protein
MSYNNAYNECDQNLDTHYSRTCDDKPEKGRIRRGAWIKSSYYSTLMQDPTDDALWSAGITAGDIIILYELAGTFDGGSPKMSPGFGDQKEQYTGSDFKANIKDPVYALNWAHYKSLVGKQTWHFCYLTETKGHITSVPVTVAPKNPITENVEDSVIWEAEVSWFEYFTPAPHDVPVSVFTPA